MLVREKPTILQTLWQRLQAMLQIRPSSSRTMEPRLVRISAQTSPVTAQRVLSHPSIWATMLNHMI